MPVFNSTLATLIGAVVKRRSGIARDVVVDLLNERMRSIIDLRPTWSGLIKPVVVSFPATYTTGTVAFNAGSNTVTGTATAWPVNDVVNTNIVEQINGPQQLWVTPASMIGITRETILYVDAAGPNPEILPVQDILANRVLLTFNYPHAANSTATMSSLAQLQFRLASFNTPIYTVLAVTSPTTIVVDQICGQTIPTGSGYNILKMYTTIDPQIKEILTGYDPFQQIMLRLDVPQTDLNRKDPNRTATNSPLEVSPRSPQANGFMTYEIWPPTYIAYQLVFQIRFQWPDMRMASDYPPPFINPNALIYGALADAFKVPCPRPPDYKDPFFNLDAAMAHEQMFDKAVLQLIEADEARQTSMLTYEKYNWSLGANWAVSHDDTPYITP